MLPLPINIDDLLAGQIVNRRRIAFLKRWDAQKVIHAMCGFANDINNKGGGYIIIGIDEKNGEPIFPPIGLDRIDEHYKELHQLSYRLRPVYQTMVTDFVFQEKKILVVWCPAGKLRPYRAPTHFSKDAPYFSYVRKNSILYQASEEDCQEMTKQKIPFDDQVSEAAEIFDLQIDILKDYLRDVKSDLVFSLEKMSLEKLLRQMHLIEDVQENPKPLNIALFMFSRDPNMFFPGTWIEMVDKTKGSQKIEKKFQGPIHIQLKNIFHDLRSVTVDETNLKKRDLKRVIIDAICRKDYTSEEPIKICIKKDQVDVSIKYPKYGNRRIKDLLAALQLTKYLTGFQKTILREKNLENTPDVEKTHRCVDVNSLDREISAIDTGVFFQKTHQLELVEKKKERVVKKVTKPAISSTIRKDKKGIDILIQELCAQQPLTAQQLIERLHKKDKKHFVRTYLTPMIKAGTLKYLYPNDIYSPNQAYVTHSA